MIIHILILVLAIVAAPASAGAHTEAQVRIAELTLALADHPGDPSLWVERASEYLEIGDPAAALRDLDRASALAAYRADVPLARGATLLALGRAAEAEQQLTLAIIRDPASPVAYALRARAQQALGRPLEAAAGFGRSVELSPLATPDQFLEWSRALAAPKAGRIEDALAVLDRGLAAIGESMALVEEAVRLECARGAWDEALARIERHPAAWGSSAAGRARRGDVLRAAGRELEAQAEYSAALSEIEARGRPGSVTPLETRLHAALRQGPPTQDTP